MFEPTNSVVESLDKVNAAFDAFRHSLIAITEQISEFNPIAVHSVD